MWTDNNEPQKFWQIYKKCDIEQQYRWMIQIWDACPINLNPRFPKQPMSNWLHPLMAMIKVSPIGMWIMTSQETASK